MIYYGCDTCFYLKLAGLLCIKQNHSVKNVISSPAIYSRNVSQLSHEDHTAGNEMLLNTAAVTHRVMNLPTLKIHSLQLLISHTTKFTTCLFFSFIS